MNKYDQSGVWRLYLDRECKGRLPSGYNDEINLPGTVSGQKKTEQSGERASGFLTDPYKYEGHAWFARDIFFPAEWVGKEIWLCLERTRMTELYVDGISVGKRKSLCTPHLYRLPELGTGLHTFEICVKNVGYPTKGGHLTSPDTQTNWLGITGEIALIVRPGVHTDDITVLSSTDERNVRFTFSSTGEAEAYITVDGDRTDTVRIHEGENSCTYTPSKPLALWDEFSPAVHKLRIAVNGEMNTVDFGIRRLVTKGRRLYINGREAFLRGKHDGMLFPMTGAAPTDTQSWLKVMKRAKEYGIDHYRFHTCCPPEAAFKAADILGIYLEPELPFWGTVEEQINEEQQFLIDEGFAILKAFGNHPSFVMFSLGNELWGSKQVMSDILLRYKKADDRHLYLDGSNNFQFFPAVPENSDILCGVRLSKERLYRGSYAMCDAPLGFIQTDAPNTKHNYDKIIVPEVLSDGEKAESGGTIKIQYGTGVKEVEAGSAETFIPEVPVISHEVGQYETYPDYSEIEKYTGVLKAYNLGIYKKKAEEKGLLPYADKFFRASGALAADCYKREIEAALKSEELSGFQLLDIQDFTGQGTALVGVLNSFMEPKGTISAEKWRGFCNSTVVMAELEKFVFSSDEKVEFEVTLFNTDPAFGGKNVNYRILNAAMETVQEGRVEIRLGKRVNRLGSVSFSASGITAPTVYRLELSVEGTDIRNDYSFAVYPPLDITITRGEIACGEKKVRFSHSLEETFSCLKKGEKTIYVPGAEGKLEGMYCTDFWCYPMFRSISESMGKPEPVGTMGCLIDNESDALRLFPSETYSTPRWYEIVSHSHCEDLDGTEIIPTVWMIDNPDRAKKLGLLYTMRIADKPVTVCTCRLWEIAEKPEAKAFAFSLLSSLYAGK